MVYVGQIFKIIFDSQIHIAAGLWNLETLDLVCRSEKSDHLSKLLENQKALDTLRLDGCYFYIQNQQLDLHPELKIRRLLVNDASSISLLPLRVALKFGGKVECLKYLGNCSEENLRQILQHFSSVKVLTLRAFDGNENFYNTATVNTELSELYLDTAINWKALFGVFRIFPCLKKLSIKMDSYMKLGFSELSHEELSRLRGNLNQLDRFTVAFSNPFFDNFFAAFKKFAQKITDLYLKMNFLSTSKSLNLVCQNVKFLSIEEEHGSAIIFNINEILECFPRLKTLQLCFYVFDATKHDLLEAIKDKAKNLKFLKLQNAPKDLVRALNHEASCLGIDGLSITSTKGNFDFNFMKKDDFEFK